MFKGANPLSLDAKWRLSIPTKYRQRLQTQCEGQLVITVDPDHCLLLYPQPVWDQLEVKLVKLSSTVPREHALKRLLLGHADDCPMDGSGRILLPAPLRDYANIDKRIVLAGQGDKFEIWDEQTWYDKREEWIELQRSAAGQDEFDKLAY